MLTPNLLKRIVFIAALLTLFVILAPSFANAEPPHQGGGFVYYVRPGDTLFWISQRYGTTVSAIMSANGLASDNIHAGLRIIIPAGSNPYGFYPYGYAPRPIPPGSNPYGYYPYGYGWSIYAPQPLPPITPIANPTFNCAYTVRPGDTVFSIAYRARVPVAALMQANNLFNPLIFANQPFRVPCEEQVTPFQTYTVLAGDTLFGIAVKFSTTVWALSLVNGIPNPNLIFANQVLVIPYPGSYVYTNAPGVLTPVPTHLVISQFRTHGPNGANDQFVEIYNPTSGSVNVSGWFLKASNSSVSTFFTFPANTQLNSGQHYLITNNAAQGYSASVAADQNFNSSIPDNGGIALALADGTIVDQVGMSAATALKEGTPLAPLSTNEDRSYERKVGGGNGNCTDTNNNVGDFSVIAPSAPRNLASGLVYCATNVTPTPTPSHALISQFRTHGPNGANDQFVEIYNPTNNPINVSGWFLKASNSAVSTFFTFPANTQLNHGQHYLVTNNAANGYSGSVSADQNFNSSIPDNGGIALTLADGTIVDQVGMSATTAFKEGTPLAPLSTIDNRSYERKLGGGNGNCTDTNNNVNDFTVINPSNPRNLSTAAIPCNAGVSSTPVPGATNTPIGGGNTVQIQNNAFLPPALTISVGTTVIWTNKDVTQHTVRSGTPGAVTSPLQSPILNAGDTYSYTFVATGIFQYFDEVKNGTGSITVQ